MPKSKNFLPSRGLRLLPYQDEIVKQTMDVEGLSQSGAMRFLMMLGAHALKQEDRLSDKLDKIDGKLDLLLKSTDQLVGRGR